MGRNGREVRWLPPKIFFLTFLWFYGILTVFSREKTEREEQKMFVFVDENRSVIVGKSLVDVVRHYGRWKGVDNRIVCDWGEEEPKYTVREIAAKLDKSLEDTLIALLYDDQFEQDEFWIPNQSISKEHMASSLKRALV